MALAPADPIGTSSPPQPDATCSASAGGRVRLTMKRGRPERDGASTGTSYVAKVRSLAGTPQRPP